MELATECGIPTARPERATEEKPAAAEKKLNKNAPKAPKQKKSKAKTKAASAVSSQVVAHENKSEAAPSEENFEVREMPFSEKASFMEWLTADFSDGEPKKVERSTPKDVKTIISELPKFPVQKKDGKIDVYVSNYRLQPNHLWLNRGEGKFEEVAESFGAAGVGDGGTINYTGGIQYRVFGHTIGSALGDLDDDGHIDIFVGNFSHPRAGQDHPQFLRNLGGDGEFKFEDRSEGSGLGWQESFASAALGDYDNDGDLDLYFTTVYAVGSGSIKNFPVLYANEGSWKFKNTTKDETLPDLPPTYQSAWADIDNDGDLDLCTAGKLFRNDATRGHWIELDLVGDGTQVSRSAFGAVARIRVGDRTLTRFVEPGTGEGNQSDARLHFGLGDHQDAVTVEITWPGGKQQSIQSLQIDQRHRIVME